MSPNVNVELTAVLMILGGLALWIFAVGRKSITRRDLDAVEKELHGRIDKKVGHEEYNHLRDDLRDVKSDVRQIRDHLNRKGE